MLYIIIITFRGNQLLRIKIRTRREGVDESMYILLLYVRPFAPNDRLKHFNSRFRYEPCTHVINHRVIIIIINKPYAAGTRYVTRKTIIYSTRTRSSRPYDVFPTTLLFAERQSNSIRRHIPPLLSLRVKYITRYRL